MAGMANLLTSTVVSKPLTQESDNPKPSGPWTSLFLHGNASKLKTTLNHFKPVVKDGVAEVPEAVIEKSSKEWEEYMVGFFIGKRLPYPLVKDVLQKQWKLQTFEMVADDDLFYFKFQSEEDKAMVIDKGPIFIAGRLFVLKFWNPVVDKGKNLISSVPIWVKFEDVPKRLWSEDGLGFIASLLGKPVCLDEATLKKTRLKFAKVCIEVDLECPFPKSLKIKLGEDIVVIKVEYTWIPSKCYNCSSFGHQSNKCTRKVSSSWQVVADIAGPSCIRNAQGVEIPESSMGGQTNNVAENSSPTSSPTKGLAVQGSKSPSPICSGNRFLCLQDALDENMDECVNDTQSPMHSNDAIVGEAAVGCEIEEEIPSSLAAKEAKVILAGIAQLEATAPPKTHESVKAMGAVEVGFRTPSVVGRSKSAQHIYFKSPISSEVVGFDEKCCSEEDPETQTDFQLARAAEDWADMIVQEEGEWAKSKKKNKKSNWKEKARRSSSK